jgi:hypothetical protein
MTLISFIAVRPPAPSGRGDDVHVHDGVDLGLRDDLGDQRVADVGAHELGAARAALAAAGGRHGVDADDRSIDGSAASTPASRLPR